MVQGRNPGYGPLIKPMCARKVGYRLGKRYALIANCCSWLLATSDCAISMELLSGAA